MVVVQSGAAEPLRLRPVQLRAAQVAEVTGGTLVGPDVDVSGVSIDSRSVAPGGLFVAVRAERDGHDFVADAVAAGASACLCERDVDAPVSVVVPDTMEALTRLGSHARDRLGDRVVGITGSVGKTSTKDLAASVLRRGYSTWASQRSFNNELGVPLTLLGAPDDTEVTVVEMGMRGLGHITALCDVARPTMGVVTAVQLVHVETVGSLEQVAVAKRELVEALPSHGHAVLNADDPRVAAMAAHTDATVVMFGHGGHVAAEGIVLDDDLRARFHLVSDWGNTDVLVAARGLHQVGNALAAAAVGLVWGVPVEGVAEGLASADLSPWRMEVGTSASGATVINDAYNAGPASMEAALRSLAAVGAHRHIAVLGLMNELGSHSAAEHRRIAEVASSLGIRVIAVAQPEYGVDDLVPDAAAAVELLGPLGPGDAVLVKASRIAGLETLAAALLEG
jgi:UDP-N-acetylmuramoyl-tripeptide--D-alanyl-D-alanine ligase